MKLSWSKSVRFSIPLFLLLVLFQNCGPAKLVGDSDSSGATNLGSVTGHTVGSKVDLSSLLQASHEDPTNVLFPSANGTNEYDYALSSPILENVVLKENRFDQIEWIHGPSSTVVAIGDAFNQSRYAPELSGVYYILGYKNQTPFIITQIQIVDKSSTTLGVDSANAVTLTQSPVSSDSTTEKILIVVDAPAVDLNSVQFILKNDNSSVTGKRAILVTKKLSDSFGVETVLTDVSGKSVFKTIDLASKTSPSPGPSPTPDPAPTPASCSFAGKTIASGSSVTTYQYGAVPYGQSCVSETRTCNNGTLSGTYQYTYCSVLAAASCSFNGNSIASGSTITAFLASSVPYGQSCTSQVRTCSNGTLSGTYQYGSCSVQAAANCTFNGSSIANGTSVTAYQASSVPYGSTCASQARTCSNGTLSGTYQYASCSVQGASSCTFNGATVANGATVTAFQASSVPYGQSCSSQTRTCTNGALSGTYLYGSCSVEAASSCSFNGSTLTSGSSVTAYQSSSVAYGQSCTSQVRTCSNGTLSGTYQYGSCSVQAAANCTFNNTTVTNGTSVTAYQSSSVAYGQSCAAETRTCSNGTLSGSYQYGSCSVQAAVNCTFNGSTVANGASVTAYQASSVSYGGTCSSQTRTCSNGTLSGTYLYGSCSVQAPTGPTITSGPTASEITSSSAKITWSLSEVATGQVEYGTTTAYGKLSNPENTFNYSTHIQILTGLTSSTTYHYRVVSKNSAGGQVVSADKTFTTLSALSPNSVTAMPGGSVTAARGASVQITFGIENSTPLSEAYVGFIHIVSDSNYYGQEFGYDYTPSPATNAWSGNITYKNTITVPSTLAPGTYTIRIGFYINLSPYTRASLQVGPGVTNDGDSRYIVGTITVQ